MGHGRLATGTDQLSQGDYARAGFGCGLRHRDQLADNCVLWLEGGWRGYGLAFGYESARQAEEGRHCRARDNW